MKAGAPPQKFEYRNRQFAFVGFHVAGESIGDSNQPRFLIGRLAKHKQIGLGQLTDEDVIEHLADDWIPIWVIFDLRDQYVGVELNSRFGRLDHVQSVIGAGLSRGVADVYKHDVVVSPVTNPKRFWDVVQSYKCIYRISLHFVSPNIFNTPASARETIESWQQVFNQTEANIVLKNDHGELVAEEEALADPIEYISEGEGDWRVTVANSQDEPRVTFSSTDDIEGFELEIPRAAASVEQIAATPEVEQSLLNRLLAVISRRHAT